MPEKISDLKIRQIRERAVKGEIDKTIAEELDCSPSTVKKYAEPMRNQVNALIEIGQPRAITTIEDSDFMRGLMSIYPGLGGELGPAEDMQRVTQPTGIVLGTAFRQASTILDDSLPVGEKIVSGGRGLMALGQIGAQMIDIFQHWDKYTGQTPPQQPPTQEKDDEGGVVDGGDE